MFDLPTRDEAGDAVAQNLGKAIGWIFAMEAVTNAYAVGRLIDGQAIANKPQCKHGNIYPHIIHDSIVFGKATGTPNFQWCRGAPELAALLDALTKEKTDG